MLERHRLILAAVLIVSAACAHGQRDARPGTLRIYLARHGQTDWNLERRLQGKSNTELNATGRQQAAALAEKLGGVTLDAIYSSSLNRSRSTAEAVAAGHPVQALSAFDERGVGKFEGVWVDGRDAAIKEEWERRVADPEDSLDGGESTEQHYQRVSLGVDEVVARHPSGTILIVGHGGTNTLILRRLLGLTPEQARAINQANDELYAVEVRGGRANAVWKEVPVGKLGEL